MIKEMYTFQEVRDILGLGVKALRNVIERGEIKPIGRKISKTEIEKVLGHPIENKGVVESEKKEEPQEIIDTKLTTETSIVNKNRIEAEIEEIKAQKRLEALQNDMTFEEYQEEKSKLTTLLEKIQESESKLEEREVLAEQRERDIESQLRKVSVIQTTNAGFKEWYNVNARTQVEMDTLLIVLEGVFKVVENLHPSTEEKYIALIKARDAYRDIKYTKIGEISVEALLNKRVRRAQ